MKLINIEQYDFPLSRAQANEWSEWVMTIPQDIRSSTHFRDVHKDHAKRGLQMNEETAASIESEVRKRMKPRYSYLR